MQHLLECINLFAKVDCHCLITGDFNCNGIDWVTLTAPSGGPQEALLNCAIENGFSQLVQRPTRRVNLLHLVISNEPLAVCNIIVKHLFSNSDHCQVEFSIFTDSQSEPANYNDVMALPYDWDKGDYNSVCDYLFSVNWLNVVTVNHTVDSLWNAFSNVLQTAIDLYVPKKSAINCANTKCQRWYLAALRRAISRKRCQWRKKKDDLSNTNLAAS